jgi:hypothetical protein
MLGDAVSRWTTSHARRCGGAAMVEKSRDRNGDEPSRVWISHRLYGSVESVSLTRYGPMRHLGSAGQVSTSRGGTQR